LQLPIPIAAFLRAANSHDTAALLATLAEDAVVSDLGREIRGAELRSWSDALFVKSHLAVRAIEVTERNGSTVVSVVVHGVKPGTRKHIRRDWWFTVDGKRIAALETVPAREPDLPPPVAGFVRSTNAGDLEALMAVFAEGAMGQRCDPKMGRTRIHRPTGIHLCRRVHRARRTRCRQRACRRRFRPARAALPAGAHLLFFHRRQPDRSADHPAQSAGLNALGKN
jgi:hypothetical protein